MNRSIFAALLSLLPLSALAQGISNPGVVGPGSATSAHIAVFSGTSGNIIGDGGIAAPPCSAFGTTAGTCAQGNDSRITGAAQQTTGTWTPAVNGFTVVGSAPVASGIYVKTGLEVTLTITLVCSGGCTTTASVAGTSYLSGGPPYVPSGSTGAVACAGSVDNTTGVSKGGGYYNTSAGNGQFFPPTWAATSDTLVSTCTFQSAS